jgi:hypothetical protein
MKSKYLIYMLFATLVGSATSCLEEDEKFAKLQPAPGNIIFVLPDESLAVPPANQPVIVQPSLDVVAGRFPKAGNLAMTIQLPAGYTELTINIVTTAGVRQNKATFSGISGSVDYTAPMNKAALNNGALTTSAVYEFVASGSAGTVTRMFTVNGI